MIPVLTLIDDNGNGYTLPEDFWLESFNLNVNVNIQNYTYAAGGKNIADGFPIARNIVVTGMLRADTQLELEAKRRAFFFACLKGGKLQRSDDAVSRYITVKYADFNYSKGNWIHSEMVTVTFIAEYPFWVDSSETVVEPVFTTFDVDATGSDYIVLPTITITNPYVEGSFGFNLYNTTDGSNYFSYNDDNAALNDIIIINSFTGEVTKNGNEAFENIVDPWFIRLQPTVNSLSIEGPAVDVSVAFRKVYI